MTEKDKIKDKLKVSDKFIEIFLNFQICDQSKEMFLLTRIELYLLLILAIDKYDENNKFVLDNLKPFKKEVELILLVHDSKEVDDPDLIKAGELTGEEYVDIYMLVDKDGNRLPNIYTQEEAIILRREKNISNLIK